MKEIITTIDIQASPEAIWQVLTDFESYPEWNPFVQRISGELGLGQQLSVFIQPPGKNGMQFHPRITQWEPTRLFAWLGNTFVKGIVDGQHFFELESLSEGVTRLTQREEFTGLLVPMFFKQFAEATKEGFSAMNRALKDRVEARVASSGVQD